jgi:hypothetical protein
MTMTKRCNRIEEDNSMACIAVLCSALLCGSVMMKRESVHGIKIVAK